MSSITRDSAGNLVKKTVAVAAVQSVGNVSTIGAASIDLSNVKINNQTVSITLNSVQALQTTAGAAQANKVVIADSSKSVSGISEVNVNELWIGNKKVTGVINSGAVVSNSPSMNNIQPGVAAAYKAVSAASDLSVSNVNSISATNVVLNGTTVSVPTFNYTYSLETSHYNNMAFTSAVPFSGDAIGYGSTYSAYIVSRVPQDYYARGYIGTAYGMVNSILYKPTYEAYMSAYYASQTNYFMGVSNSLTYYPNSSNMGTPVTATIGTTGSICSTFDPSSVKYISSLGIYVVATYSRNVANTPPTLNPTASAIGYWDVFYGSSLASLTKVNVCTSTTAAWTDVHRPNIVYAPSIGKILMLVHTSLSQTLLIQSSNGSTWTTLKTMTYTPGALCATSSTIYIVPVSRTDATYNTLITMSSSDGITWTNITRASTVIPSSMTRVYTINNTHYFYGQSSVLFTTDFITMSGVGLTYQNNVPYPSGNPTTGMIYFNSFMTSVMLNPTTSTTTSYYGVSWLDGAFYANGIASQTSSVDKMWKFASVPSNPSLTNTVKCLKLSPEQYLEMESWKTAPIYDFVYVPEKSAYLCIGNLGDTYGTAPTASYVYSSTDLESFTMISSVGILANAIVWNSATSTMIAYTVGGTTANARYSTDGGATWLTNATLLGAGATNIINQIVFSKLFQGWGISISNAANTAVILTISKSIDGSDGIALPGGQHSTGFSGSINGGLFTDGDYYCYYSSTSIDFLSLFDVIKFVAPYTNWSYYNSSSNTTYTYDFTYLNTTYYGNKQLVPSAPTTYSGAVSISNTTYTTTAGVPYAILSPVYIEPLKMWVGFAAGGSMNNSVIVYRSADTGNGWNSLLYTKLAVDTFGFRALKWNPVDGYLYILGKYYTFRSKHSLYYYNLQTTSLSLKDPYSPSQSTNTGYELNAIYKIRGGAWSGIAYGSRVVIAASTNTLAWSATNSQSPTSVTVAGDWQDVAYGAHVNTWVAVGTNSIATSINSGSTWSTTTLTGAWKSITYSLLKKMYVAVGDNIVGYSTTGLSWTTANSSSAPLITGLWKRVGMHNGVFAAVGVNCIAQSSDGITWAPIAAGSVPAGTWTGVSYGFNKWVVVGSGGSLMGATLATLSPMESTPCGDVLFIPAIDQFVMSQSGCLRVWAMRQVDASNATKKTTIATTTIGTMSKLIWVYRTHSFLCCGSDGVWVSNHLQSGLDNSLISLTPSTLSASGATYSNLAIGGTSTTADEIYVKTASTTVGQVLLKNTTDDSTCEMGVIDSINLTVKVDKLNLTGNKIIQGSLITATASDFSRLATAANTAQASKAIKSDINSNVKIGPIKTNGVVVNQRLYAPSISTPISSLVSGEPLKALTYNDSIKLDAKATSIKVGDAEILLPKATATTYPSNSIPLTSYQSDIPVCYYPRDVVYMKNWGLFVGIADTSIVSYGGVDYNSTTSAHLMILMSKDGVEWHAKKAQILCRALALLVNSSEVTEAYAGLNQTGIYILAHFDSGSKYMYYMGDPDTITLSSSFTNIYNGLTLPASGSFVSKLGNTSIFNVSSSPRFMCQTSRGTTALVNRTHAAADPYIGSGTPIKVVQTSDNIAVGCNATQAFCVTIGSTSGSASAAVAFTIADMAIGYNYTTFTYPYNCQMVVCGSGGYIAYTSGFNPATQSPPTLTSLKIDAGGLAFTSITFNPITKRYCAVGASCMIYVSNPGSTLIWTKVDASMMNQNIPFNFVRHLGEKGFAVSRQDTFWPYLNASMFSIVSDSGVFKPSVTTTHTWPGKGCYCDGKFFIPSVESGIGLKYLQSTDGYSWQYGSLSTAASNPCYSMISDGSNTVIALMNTGGLYTSKDSGNTWTPYLTSASGSVAEGMWCSGMGMFIVLNRTVTTGNNVYTSRDGITWTGYSLLTDTGAVNNNLYYIAYSPSLNMALLMVYGGSTLSPGCFASSYNASTGVVTWNSTGFSGSFTRSVANVNCGSSTTLYWSESISSFVCQVAGTSGSYWMSSKDGYTWNSFPGWVNVDSGNTPMTFNRVPVSIPGLGEVVAGSAQSTSLIQLNNGYCRSILPLNTANTGLVGSIYAPDQNRLLLYALSLSSVSAYGEDTFVVVELDEYTSRNMTEVALDKAATAFSSADASSLSWKAFTPNISTTGPLRWIESKKQFWGYNTGAMALNNHFTASANGYTWVSAVNNATITPANTSILGMVEMEPSQMVIFHQSTTGFASVLDTTAAATTMSGTGLIPGFTSRFVWFNPKSQIMWCQSSTTNSLINYLDVNQSFSMRQYSVTIPQINFNVAAFVWNKAVDIIYAFPTTGTTVATMTGDVWGTLQLPISASWSCCASGNGIVVLMSSSGECVCSTTGGSFSQVTLPVSGSWSDVQFVVDFQAFIAVSSTSSVNSIIYSVDGVNWSTYTLSAAAGFVSITYSPILNLFVANTGSTLWMSLPVIPRIGNSIKCSTSVQTTSAYNDVFVTQHGGISVGGYNRNTEKAYSIARPQLYLNTDSTYKPTSSTWTVTSDERLKEGIQPADLDRCMEIVNSIPLKYYKWKDDYIEEHNLSDKHKIGWIAQDVAPYFPNSVSAHSAEDIEGGLLGLNSDQLIASMYGSIQQLAARVKKLKTAGIQQKQ
jgi:hypothetical protein